MGATEAVTFGEDGGQGGSESRAQVAGNLYRDAFGARDVPDPRTAAFNLFPSAGGSGESTESGTAETPNFSGAGKAVIFRELSKSAEAETNTVVDRLTGGRLTEEEEQEQTTFEDVQEEGTVFKNLGDAADDAANRAGRAFLPEWFPADYGLVAVAVIGTIVLVLLLWLLRPLFTVVGAVAE